MNKGVKRRYEKAKEIIDVDENRVAEYFGITPASFRSSTARERYCRAFADIVFDVRAHLLSDIFKSLDSWQRDQASK